MNARELEVMDAKNAGAVLDETIRWLERNMPTPTGGFNAVPEHYAERVFDLKRVRALIADTRAATGEGVGAITAELRRLAAEWQKDAADLRPSHASIVYGNCSSALRALAALAAPSQPKSTQEPQT